MLLVPAFGIASGSPSAARARGLSASRVAVPPWMTAALPFVIAMVALVRRCARMASRMRTPGINDAWWDTLADLTASPEHCQHVVAIRLLGRDVADRCDHRRRFAAFHAPSGWPVLRLAEDDAGCA
jgi:hypothetical protein